MYLEKWDEDRNVRRRSKYGRFGPERKREFLGLIAYAMACVGRGSEFSHNDLAHAYDEMCHRFELPPSDVEKVLQEIESHTGLLVESGFSKYSFYHKSIQEFLCAEVIARLPLMPQRVDHLFKMPDECAIAAALTADATAFMTMLLSRYCERRESKTSPSVASFWLPFLERCRVEEVRFRADTVLAHCILGIATISWHEAPLEQRYEEPYVPDEGHEALMERLVWLVDQDSIADSVKSVWITGSATQREKYSMSRIPLRSDIFRQYTRVPSHVIADNSFLQYCGVELIDI